MFFGLQNINRAFSLTSKSLDMLGDALFGICLLLNALFLLLGAASLVLASAGSIFLHFNMKNIRILLLDFGPFMTVFTVYIEVFKGQMHTLYLACLLTESKKRNCYLSVRISISKNISSTFVVVCFSLDMLLLPFSGILTLEFINRR